MPEPESDYDAGHREGYRKGEYERIALATANSELRSQLKELEDRISDYYKFGTEP